MNEVNHPFWVIVNKEISDHVKSWRFIILIGIIALTCMGSLYTALTNIGATIKPNDPDGSFLFLKLFTASDGTLPSFTLFINFLGPLLGIALGFDAVNSEQNKGTLSRMLSQPIHRDCIINAKFMAALIVIGVMLFVLGFLVMGFGLIAIGIPPTAVNAFCKKSRTTYNGTSSGSYSKPTSIRTKSSGSMATTHGINCSNSYLFCYLLYYVYEKRNSIPIEIRTTKSTKDTEK